MYIVSVKPADSDSGANAIKENIKFLMKHSAESGRRAGLKVAHHQRAFTFGQEKSKRSVESDIDER